MADTLNKVMQMQSQGFPENEIIQRLRNENTPAKEINDALNQARVKQAVSQPIEDPQNQQIQQSQQQYPEYQMPQQDMQQMEQSIMQAPAPQDAQSQYPIPEQSQQEQQEYYYPETPQAYSGQEYYPQAGFDTDTITEIAEQVVIEKFAEFTKKTGDLITFKNTIQDKISDIDERLKKIESNIDNLQQSIIGKIGEFGDSTAAVHKDLDNLHNTVSKLMNPLIDNYKELKKISKGK